MKFSLGGQMAAMIDKKACKINTYALLFMPQTGVEPALTYVNSDLNAARLPIPPLRQPLEHIYHTKKLAKLKSQII